MRLEYWKSFWADRLIEPTDISELFHTTDFENKLRAVLKNYAAPSFDFRWQESADKAYLDYASLARSL